MEEIRKSNTRKNPFSYSTRPIIRVSINTQCVFIVSKLIAEKLQVDPKKHGLMFGFIKGKLAVKREDDKEDNYSLRRGDASTYRFRSRELYDVISDFFKVKKDASFTIEMQEDLTFKLAEHA